MTIRTVKFIYRHRNPFLFHAIGGAFLLQKKDFSVNMFAISATIMACFFSCLVIIFEHYFAGIPVFGWFAGAYP